MNKKAIKEQLEYLDKVCEQLLKAEKETLSEVQKVIKCLRKDDTINEVYDIAAKALSDDDFDFMDRAVDDIKYFTDVVEMPDDVWVGYFLRSRLSAVLEYRRCLKTICKKKRIK